MTTFDNNSMSSSKPEIRNHDLLALRAYVTAKDELETVRLSPDCILLDITHSNLQQRHIEVRFSLLDTVDDIRHRIYRTTGTSPSNQQLQIYGPGHRLIVEIPGQVPGDSVSLSSLGLVQTGCRVHCIDSNPFSISARGALENTALVEKFTLTREEYEKRQNTLYSWSKQQKERNPNFTLQKHAAQHQALQRAKLLYRTGQALPPGFALVEGQVVMDDEYCHQSPSGEQQQQASFGIDSVSHVTVGARCQVHPGERRGQVAFVGRVPEIKKDESHWVGVLLDEPVGQNDGSIKGVKYFDTPGPRYGSFVRGRHVQVGDFPERDLLEDDTDDEL